MSELSKQEQVIELVKAGESTREQIKEAVDCTIGSLASYFSTMSNIAKYSGVALCPVTNADGIMSVTTYEEAEAAKAERTASRPAASKKSPEERLDAAEKRMIRCTNAEVSAAKRAEDNPDNKELELRADQAVINLKLAEIELDRSKELCHATEAAEEDAPTEGDLI